MFKFNTLSMSVLGVAAIAVLGVAVPHKSAANTAFADATTTDPNNPTPCSACHYRGRENEGRQSLTDVGQQFFQNCRVNMTHDCHTLPQLSMLNPSPVYPSPQPAPVYNQTTPNYPQPAPVYNQPTPNYPQPAPVYNQQTPNYPQPAPVYNQPTPNYPQPAPVYNQPTPNYPQPAPVYNQTTPNYPQPAPVYNQPTPNYPQPAPVYNQPTPNYPQPTPVYNQPTPNQPQPAPVYNQPTPNYPQPAPVYNQPTPNYTQPVSAPDGTTRTQSGMAKLTDSCSTGGTYYRMHVGKSDRFVSFMVKDNDIIHVNAPVNSTFVKGCGGWPTSPNYAFLTLDGH